MVADRRRGRIDADGFLHVLDRRDDLIVSGGENVFPAEVEAVLAGHPGIAEAGVAGRPDPAWGAVRSPRWCRDPARRSRTTPSSGRSAAHARPYKVPTAFFVVESLPRTVSGKLRRSELRAALADPVPAVPPGPATRRRATWRRPDDAAREDDASSGDVAPWEDVSA